VPRDMSTWRVRGTWHGTRSAPRQRACNHVFVGIDHIPSREELGVVRSAMDAFDSIGWPLFPTDSGRAIVAASIGAPRR